MVRATASVGRLHLAIRRVELELALDARDWKKAMGWLERAIGVGGGPACTLTWFSRFRARPSQRKTLGPATSGLPKWLCI